MSVFRRFKLPQLLRKQKSDENSIVNIPRFDCNALAVKERLGQGSFGDVYTVDYKAPGKVIETVVVKKVLAALDQEEKKLFYKEVALLNGLNHPFFFHCANDSPCEQSLFYLFLSLSFLSFISFLHTRKKEALHKSSPSFEVAVALP